jgi:hypothetical protein
MLALAVDVGTTTARYQALQHAAENAAEAGAYALYGSRIGATTSLTDTGVWYAMASKLTAQGLRVMNAPGGSVPSDPCAAEYLTNQVAMTATYLDATDNVITTTTNAPWAVGSGSIPPLARGVSVTLGGCQPAGFGGVLGHPTYTIWVNGSAGRWAPGPIDTPTPDSGSAPFIPYAITAAPNGNCSNDVTPTVNYTPTVPLRGGGTINPAHNDPVQFYCKGVYTIGSTVTLYANGVGQGNNWGSDASFKGYIGGAANASTIGTENWVPAGHGNNAPSCPLPLPWQVTVPIITRVDHTGHTENFVILETVVVNITQCGDPTTGTIVSVKDDSYGYGVVSIPPPIPVPTNTPVAVGFRAAATAGTTGLTTSLPISVPAGIQNNDVLIAQVAIQNDSIPITAPSGWMPIGTPVQNSGGGIMQGLYYHVVTSTLSEPASYTWAWAGSGSNASGGIAAYDGVDTSNPIDASSGAASSSASNTIVAPSLTTTVGNTEVLGFFGARSSSAVTVPSNQTSRWSAQSTTGLSSSQNSSNAEGDTLQAAVGATGAFTATISDTQNNVGQLVALQPIGIVPLPTATITPTPLPTDTPPAISNGPPPVIVPTAVPTP